MQFCTSHAINCTVCNDPFCPAHISICSSCNLSFCNTHLTNHCIGLGSYLSSNLSARECSALELEEEKRKLSFYKNAENTRWMNVNCDFEKYLMEEETKRANFKEEKRNFEKQIQEEAAKRLRSQQADEEARDTFFQWTEMETVKLQHQQDELVNSRLAFENEKEDARVAFQREKEESLKFVTHNQGIVKLNVGGTIFQTTVSTLSNFPSMLNTKFSGRFEIKKDNSGAVFIDRDGMYYSNIGSSITSFTGTNFHHVLNFLRDGVLPSRLSVTKLEALKLEANYIK